MSEAPALGYVNVTDAVRKGIVNPEDFTDNPELPMHGMLSAAHHAVRELKVPIEANVPQWALILGGNDWLATWGWRVIRAVGERITELTPSGFRVEFGAAFTKSYRRATAGFTANGTYFAVLLPEPNALASGLYQIGPYSEAPEASANGSK
jgi:phosphate/sulfate permease